MQIKQTDEFKKDFKKLSKKYPSLEDDLNILFRTICIDPTGNGSKHWNILENKDEHYILKVRMMCRSVKGKSFRVVYYYNGLEVELECIEVYYKGDKSLEDSKRLKTFWNNKIRGTM